MTTLVYIRDIITYINKCSHYINYNLCLQERQNFIYVYVYKYIYICIYICN